MKLSYYESPVGLLQIFANNSAITSVTFIESRPFPTQKNSIIEYCEHELDEYFSGSLKRFTVSIDIQGTEFTKNVLRTVCDIPYGHTASYKEVAERAGYRGAYRAVGSVMRKNQFLVVIPCHRVVGSGGKPGGYSSGMGIKEWLLDHELKTASLD